MKSRFLASTIFFMLLGCFSSNLFGQISGASAVEFWLRSYNIDEEAITPWMDENLAATPSPDTVGHKVDYRIKWNVERQDLTSVVYTITFPKGTVLYDDVRNHITLNYQVYTLADLATQSTPDPTDDVTVSKNDTLSYDDDGTPKLWITDRNQFDVKKYVWIDITGGVYHAKKQSITNEATAVDNQKRMKITFDHSSSGAGGSPFTDNTTFYVENDRAEAVAYNAGVSGYIDSDFWPNGDSIYIVDRFGNMVPDFWQSQEDTLLLSVAADIGAFTIVPQGSGAFTSDGGVNDKDAGVIDTVFTGVDLDLTTIKFFGMSPAGARYGWEQVANQTGFSPGLLYHGLTGVTEDNLDKANMVLYFGEDPPVEAVVIGGPPVNSVGTAGLKFNAEDGEDTTAFIFTVKSINAATGKLLDVTADKVTTMVRDVFETDVSATIGELTLTIDPGPHMNLADIAGGITLTLQDVFGDAMEGDIGDDIDTVMFYFEYLDGTYDEDADEGEEWTYEKNADMTTLLQAGRKVTSKYTRPAARFIDDDEFFETVSSGNYGNQLVGGTVAAGNYSTAGAGNPVVYWGTTSHPVADKIIVTAYARKNASAIDTAMITVDPSSPVAWDLDTFSVNLEAAIANNDVVQGAQIPVDLPIFALDTAYNRVTNMDLNAGSGYLDGIVIPSSAATSFGAINFLIDDRDPVGYTSWHASLVDSIKIDGTYDNVDTDGINITSDGSQNDSSFIYNVTLARADSSRVNLGGAGDDPLGLRLLYQGVNYKLSMVWDPGSFGGTMYTGGQWDVDRTIDLGLVTLVSAAAVDSVEDIAASTDTAGAVTDVVVEFTVPAGNGIGPNLAADTVSISFIDLPEGAGIPAGITAADVECSSDDENFYTALSVGQVDNSITLRVSVAANEGSLYYVKIKNFVNPTKSDTSYGISVTTEASPVTATNPAAMIVSDVTEVSGIKILAPAYSMPAVPNYFVDVVEKDTTLVVGESALFRIVLGDRWGNVIDAGLGERGLIFKGPDTTLTGANTVVSQRLTLGTGGNMYDSLWVSHDTLANGDDPAEYSIIDSIWVVPAVAGEYTLTIMDSVDNSIIDEVSLVVAATITGSIAIVEPLGLQRTTTETVLDSTFTVLLRDTYGNLLPDSVVEFTVIYGEGTFVDSNGTAVDVPDDALSVVADAAGQAAATLKSGTTDSVVVAVDVPSNDAVTAVEFHVTTRPKIEPGPTVFTFTEPPDSLVQDTTDGVTITANALDDELVKVIYLRAITTALELDAGTGLFSLAAESETALVDTVEVSPAADDVDFVGLVPPQALATQVVYDLMAIDNTDDTTFSEQGKYLIAPKPGKMDLTADPVSITDLMRAVYLYLDDPVLTPGLVKREIDYLGLDLDQNGIFDILNDVYGIRDLWKGTSALLASAAEQENRSARVSLAYEAVDKANAVLALNLENQGNLNVAGFRVKYDVDKFVFGEVKLTERLEGIEVVFSNNETEGVYSVVVINLTGRPISSGSGAILTIPVSAVGDKFDGEGEISLLEAEFGRGVATEVDAEALSPKAILPKAFALSQNYPNPFNPSTTIAYDIPEGKKIFVRLNVYNIRGQLVRTLVNETINEGSYKIEWDGKDNNGRYTASGVYFYRIQAGDFSKTRKMVILK